MLRLSSSGKAESYCVDGDIKRVAGNTTEAALAYLNGHIADQQYTEIHLSTLEVAEKNEVTGVLYGWLKTDDASRALRKKIAVKAAPDEIWSFIFALQPQAVTTCFGRIEPLLNDKRYQQVVDSCSAILQHYPNETARLLLQRALAYTLMGNHDKEAISDYLRAFIKDKDVTIQITRGKHGHHLPQITEILRNCVYSESPNGTQESKQMKKWLQLTTDCCKLLLTLDPNNFSLQMTYGERLTIWMKLEQAIAVLNEAMKVLRLDLHPNPKRLAECSLRLGLCYQLKCQRDDAVLHFTRGLNTASHYLSNNSKSAGISPKDSAAQEKFDYDITRTFLEDNKEVQFTAKLVGEITATGLCDVNELYNLLDKAATKLNPDKAAGVMKLDNVRQASDIYRSILVFKPRNRDTLVKLALCYSKLGRHNFAIKIYDFLLSKKDYSQDNNILSARAACYREVGKKVEARKDYDVLLRDSPKDATLLFERALVHMENKDIESLVSDLQMACKSNQRTVSIYLNKLPLAQRTRIRQLLFEHAKLLLHDAKMPDLELERLYDGDDDSRLSMALVISQLLTKLTASDHAAHIIKAHALFFIGNFKDAEACLKRLLNDNPENPDNHIIKLHYGLLRVFTKHIDDGMDILVEVLSKKGERVISNVLRDMPPCERVHLADESHEYAIDILRKRRNKEVVQHAAHCLTIAILCTKAVNHFQEGLQGCDGVCRSYLARAECMAHLGDQHAAVCDFSAALEANPRCVEGLCGRAFMKLALGEEQNCVEDITCACEIDMFTVSAHISALPEEAKKLLLFWLDHKVVSTLINYGRKDRIATRSALSTSATENSLKSTNERSRESSIYAIQITSPDKQNQQRSSIQAQDSAVQAKHSSPSGFDADDEKRQNQHPEGTQKTNDVTAPVESNAIKAVDGDVDLNLHGISYSKSESRLSENLGNFHKSFGRTSSVEIGDRVKPQETGTPDLIPTPLPPDSSNQSVIFAYDDVIIGMEKAELLHNAQTLGKLLVALEPANATWHGMYADILIVKGDFDDALRHLQIVLQLAPDDVTAVARAGLINVKQSRYGQAANLLSTLVDADINGLLFVLKAFDTPKRKRLSDEALDLANLFVGDEKYRKAVEYYGLSLCASRDRRIEKLRLRSKSYLKLQDNKRAIEDIATVIRETSKHAKSGDYCSLGLIYLLDNKEKEACQNYMKALKIEKYEACLQIHAKPGRGPLARVFYRRALEEFGRRNYQECVGLCESGVAIDSTNIDLRKLRARAKKEVGNCIVQ